MKKVSKIDSSGWHLGDELVSDSFSGIVRSDGEEDYFLIDVPVPSGLKHPKWNPKTSAWGEGLTAEEIAERQRLSDELTEAEQWRISDLKDRLKNTQQALDFILWEGGL